MPDTPNTEELIARLRYMGQQYAAGQCARGGGARKHYLEEAADALEFLSDELALRRKSCSASDRLHNLCEGIAKDADGSEWSREEWERIDAETVRLTNELRETKAELARLRAERDTYKWHWEQASKQPEWNVPEPMTLLSDSDLLAVLQGWREFDKPEEFQGISYGAMRSALAAYHKALIAAAPPPPAQPAPPAADALDALRELLAAYRGLLSAMGPDATADDERRSEERFERAVKAADAAIDAAAGKGDAS